MVFYGLLKIKNDIIAIIMKPDLTLIYFLDQAPPCYIRVNIFVKSKIQGIFNLNFFEFLFNVFNKAS